VIESLDLPKCFDSRKSPATLKDLNLTRTHIFSRNVSILGRAPILQILDLSESRDSGKSFDTEDLRSLGHAKRPLDP
jgi:hypothetical protein